VTGYLSIFLFFTSKIFRYIFSILFSCLCGFLAFAIGQSIEKSSGTTGWVLAFVAFTVSLLANKEHFSFLKNATISEYEVG
jgi:hypothetical protein